MSTAAPSNCRHGYGPNDETVIDSEERTACCGAFHSFYGDGSGAYCKCCYALVTGGDELIGIEVWIDA